MINDIEFLETVCERMQQVGLVQSKAEFSTRMLGKGASYLTSMSARDRKVPDEVMTFFKHQLGTDIAYGDEKAAEMRRALHCCELEQKHRADMICWIGCHSSQLHQTVGDSIHVKPKAGLSVFARVLSALGMFHAVDGNTPQLS